MGDANPSPRLESMFSAERAKAFVDAVVAIAMTLLILPLMEAVAETSRGDGEDFDTATWLGEHESHLVAFALSFVIIAVFWMGHHRLYAQVRFMTRGLLWLNIAWLFVIVWLPVATALVGASDEVDPIAATSYVGSMIMASLLMLAMRLYLRAHPDLHDIEPEALLLLVPAVGYYWLLALLLTGPVHTQLVRLVPATRPV